MNTRIKGVNLCLFYILFLIVLNSCSNKNEIKNNQKSESMNIDVSSWDKFKELPEKIIKEVRFIPLETKEDCLLGDIKKIVVKNDRLYIIDRGINKKILVFTREGNYLGSIGKYGKGPGEFLSLNDFIIDDDNGKVLILDAQQRKVVIYNLKDYTFLDEFKIGFPATNFAMLDNDVLSFYSKFPQTKSGTNYSIANLSLKDKSFKWLLEKDGYDTNTSYDYSIFQSENLYFASYFKNIIYRISNEAVEPYIIFDFGQAKIPESKLEAAEKDSKKISEMLAERNYSYGIGNVLENDKFLTFNLRLENKDIMGIYSKSSKDLLYGYQYDNELSALDLIRNIAVDGDCFFSAINAQEFKRVGKMIEKVNGSRFKDKYIQKVNELSDFSNPVIISIKYNSF